MYRKNRTKHGGGVFCAIKDGILAIEETALGKDNECVWTSIQFAKSQKFYLGSFYRSPRAPIESLDLFDESLNDLFNRKTNKHPNVIVAGHFNTPDISWETDEITGNSDAVNARRLQAITEQYGLTQHQHEVTRPASDAVLDLVFCSKPNIGTSVEVVPGMSDHLAILTTVNIRPKPIPNHHTRYIAIQPPTSMPLRADMETYANQFLHSNVLARSINENWCELKVVFYMAMKKHIPTAMTKSRHDLPWLTTDIKRQIRRKDRCYRKARKTKTKSDLSTYQRMRQNIQALMKTAHDTCIRDVIGASLCEQGNQKKFWSFVKLNKTENIGIPILSDTDGLHIMDNAKAEALDSLYQCSPMMMETVCLTRAPPLFLIWTILTSHNLGLRSYLIISSLTKQLAPTSYQPVS